MNGMDEGGELTETPFSHPSSTSFRYCQPECQNCGMELEIGTHQSFRPCLYCTHSQREVAVGIARINVDWKVLVVFQVQRVLLVNLLHIQVDNIFKSTEIGLG